MQYDISFLTCRKMSSWCATPSPTAIAGRWGEIVPDDPTCRLTTAYICEFMTRAVRPGLNY